MSNKGKEKVPEGNQNTDEEYYAMLDDEWDARTTPFHSSGNTENHLGDVQQRNTEHSEYQDNHLEYNPQKNRELLVKMVIDNKSMLEHVENPFLVEFAKSLQPSYSHVTRRDVEEDCLTFYKKEKAQLKDKITNLTSKVSISVVSCINPKAPGPLLCFAAHFIDNEFKLVKKVIGIWDSYDAERNVNYWELGDKVFAWSKEYYNRGSGKFSPTLDVNCILECFRSIANKIYNEISSFYIIEMMNDLNECPEKMCYFNEIAAGHNLARKFEFVLTNKGVLGFDLNILNEACTYKNVFCLLSDKNVGWSEVEEVVRLLNRINDAVVMLCSHEFPTSNLLLKFVFEIIDVLSEASPVLFGVTKDAIDWSLATLDRYLASCDNIVLIASLLDPRFQLKFCERYIGKFIANTEEFNEFLASLYMKYQSEVHSGGCVSHKLELNKYFERSRVEEGDGNFDVLGWWKDNKLEYPILSRMARDILAIPISSSLTSGTEHVTEIGNEIFLSTIDTEMSKVLVCCNSWLRSGHNAGNNWDNQGYPEHSNRSNSCVYDQKKCLELLAKLVISSELPFYFVKSTWFIEWAKNLQPLYTPVDLASFKTKCLGVYRIERQRFKGLLEELEKEFENSAHLERVCFSAHLAEEFSNTSLCVTAHFIDKYFNLVRRIIGITIIVVWHKGCPSRITAQVQRCIDNWCPPRKVLAFTTEIFVNEYYKNILDGLTGCVGTIKLHCVVRGLFNGLLRLIWVELHEVFGSIRKMIKFLAEDPNVMHTINHLCPIGLKINTPLQLDDQRRWDSTLNMLYDALAYKDVFYAYKSSDESFPLCENWNEVESAVKLLKPIYEAVTILSSSQYPTSNLVLKIVFEIYDVLSHVVFNTNNDYDKEKFLDCFMEISDYFLNDCNNIFLVASLLDPRFKLIYLERCYAEHISDKEEIEKCIGDLCIEFEIQHDGEMSELKRYLQEDLLVVRDGDFDVLRWWKDNQSNYPILSMMARHILAIPVSSLPSEFAFSPSFRRNNIVRFGNDANKCGPRTLETLVCSNNWLSAASSIATIDLVAKHIPPSFKCPLRVCDFWSVCFLKRALMGRMLEQIVAIHGAILTAENMQCLIKPIDKDVDSWIPDEVINCYIGIMNKQGSTSGKILKLSTFGSQLLQSWGSGMGENEKLIIEKGNEFLDNELVFLPILVQDHRFVVALNASKMEFQILNSLNSLGGPYEETTHTLRLGIQRCIDVVVLRRAQAWRPDINVVNWPIIVISNLPQQKDRCSCGLFALKYMQLWDGSKLATEFTQDDIDLFRKQLVGELIFSELNEMKNIQDEIKKRKLFTEEPIELEESQEESQEESDESAESEE